MSQAGLLFVISEPPAALDEELNEWYDKEHIPERLVIEGFLTAKRFVTATRARRYLALYDLTHADVLHTDAYLAFAGANFTPWTKRVVTRAKFWRMEAARVGSGDGVTVAAPRHLVLRFSNLDDRQRALVHDGAEACFAGRANVAQWRSFDGREERSAMALVIVSGAGDIEALYDPATFGVAAGQLDLMETFLPYE